MSKMITFKVDGLRELEATMVKLPRAVAKRTARQSMIQSLEPIAGSMASKAPRLTGATGNSVNVGTNLSRSQKRFAGFAGGPRDADTLVVSVGPGAMPQALLQEIGTFKDAPQAYARPAWDSHSGSLLTNFAGIFGPRLMAAFDRASAKGKLR